MLRLALLFVLLPFLTAAVEKPEQLHLSLTENVGEMRVMYLRPTLDISKSPSDDGCFYGPSADAMNQFAKASVHTYSAGGFKGSIHSAVMTTEPSKEYFYQCGSKTQSSLSTIYSFRAPPAPMSDDTIRIASFGDMGAAMPGVGSLIGRDSSHTQALMNSYAEKGEIDLVINVGDSSYANDIGRIKGHIGNNSYVYDAYFNQIEPTVARAPMMMCPGNHESEYNYAPYLNRTMMPVVSTGPLGRFYNSWDYGPVHVVTFSTESQHSIQPNSEQWKFLRDDLSRVNRTLTPWVIAFSHHPVYCTDMLVLRTRCGVQGEGFRQALEPLFHEFAVDLYIAGHNHIYERDYPTFNHTRASTSYHNAAATVYITNGAAGDMEGTEPTGFDPLAKIRAKGVWGFETGFLRMEVNRTSMSFAYMNSVAKSELDSFVMSKDRVVESFRV